MKAAVLHDVGTPLSIESVQIDNPKSHEVLVRTAACGVCRSDLHFITGSYAWPMPTILGHEAAGVVEKVGSEVRYVKPGDHVITCLSVFCGHCEFCTTGRPFSCQNPEVARADDEAPRLSRDGGAMHQFLSLSAFAEYMLIHEHALVKIRDDMPLDRAALIGCGVTTGFGAVINTAKVRGRQHRRRDRLRRRGTVGHQRARRSPAPGALSRSTSRVRSSTSPSISARPTWSTQARAIRSRRSGR